MTLDFQKLDKIAEDTIHELGARELTPEEITAVCVLMAKTTMRSARRVLGDEAELSAVSEASMHFNQLELEQERSV